MKRGQHPMVLHSSAFLLAIGLLFAAGQTDQFDRWCYPKPAKVEVAPVGQHLPKRIGTWQSAQDELIVRQALRQGIVLIGSSELSHAHQEEIPYRFYKEQLPYPLMAFGQAGHQCGNIFTTLAAMGEDLRGARLAIILSTGWFEGKYAKGTNSDVFLSYHNPRLLHYIDQDTTLTPELKAAAGELAASHFHNIGNPGPLLRKWYYKQKQSISPFHRLVFAPFTATYSLLSEAEHAAKVLQLKAGEIDLDYRIISTKRFLNATSQVPIPVAPLWDKLKSEGSKKAALASTSNNFGINDTYYKEVLAQNQHRPVHPKNLDDIQEYQDLLHLLQLLEHYESQVVFVMQSFHPVVYQELATMDANIEKIQATVEAAGFTFLNLHTSDPEQYEIGTLTDMMHTGPLGWMEINQAIYEHLILPKS
ncbi:MAG: D-alanyl-lipoteichoic acid biosynthesis protein DltD [Salibacteraceae bacterium]